MAIGMCMKPCPHTGQVGPALAGWAGFSWLGWLCLLSLVALIFGGILGVLHPKDIHILTSTFILRLPGCSFNSLL